MGVASRCRAGGGVAGGGVAAGGPGRVAGGARVGARLPAGGRIAPNPRPPYSAQPAQPMRSLSSAESW